MLLAWCMGGGVIDVMCCEGSVVAVRGCCGRGVGLVLRWCGLV